MGTTWPAGFSESASIDVVLASADTVWSTLSDIEEYPNIFSTIDSVTVLDHPNHRSQQQQQQNRPLATTTATSTTRNNILDTIQRSTSTETTSAVGSGGAGTIKRELYNGLSWNETRTYHNGKTATFQKCVTSVSFNEDAINDVTTTSTSEREDISSSTTTQPVSNSNISSKSIVKRRCVRINVTVPSHSKFSGIVNTFTWMVEETVNVYNDDGTRNNTGNTCRLYFSTGILPNRSFMIFTMFCCFLKGRNINMVNEKVKNMLLNEINEIATEAERRQQQQQQQMEQQQ